MESKFQKRLKEAQIQNKMANKPLFDLEEKQEIEETIDLAAEQATRVLVKLLSDEKLINTLASFTRKMVDALEAQGFSKDEAIQLAASSARGMGSLSK